MNLNMPGNRVQLVSLILVLAFGNCCHTCSDRLNFITTAKKFAYDDSIGFVGCQWRNPVWVKPIRQRNLDTTTSFNKPRSRILTQRNNFLIRASVKTKPTFEEQQNLYRELHKVNTAAFFLGVRGKGCGRSIQTQESQFNNIPIYSFAIRNDANRPYT
jgi:hypothetical protein